MAEYTIDEILQGVMKWQNPSPAGPGGVVRERLDPYEMIAPLSAPEEVTPKQAKLSTGKRIGLAIADALQAYGASMNRTPFRSYAKDALEMAQEPLDQEAAAANRRSQMEYATKRAAIDAAMGKQASEQEAARHAERMALEREAMAQRSDLELSQQDLQAKIAQLRSHTDLEIARMRDSGDTRGKDMNDKMSASGAALRNAWLYGDAEAGVGRLADRIKAGENPQDIIQEFERRLDEIPGMTDDQKRLRVLELTMEVQKAVKAVAPPEPFVGREPGGTVRQIGPTMAPQGLWGGVDELVGELLRQPGGAKF